MSPSSARAPSGREHHAKSAAVEEGEAVEVVG